MALTLVSGRIEMGTGPLIEMGTGPLVGLDKLMFCAEFAVFMLSVLKTRRPMRVEAPLLF